MERSLVRAYVSLCGRQRGRPPPCISQPLSRDDTFLVVALFRETGQWCIRRMGNRSMTDFHDRVYRSNSSRKGKGSFPIIFLRRSLSFSLSLEFERYLEMYKSWGKRRMEHPCGEFNEAILLKRAAASFDVYRRR